MQVFPIWGRKETVTFARVVNELKTQLASNYSGPDRFFGGMCATEVFKAMTFSLGGLERRWVGWPLELWMLGGLTVVGGNAVDASNGTWSFKICQAVSRGDGRPSVFGATSAGCLSSLDIWIDFRRFSSRGSCGRRSRTSRSLRQ